MRARQTASYRYRAGRHGCAMAHAAPRANLAGSAALFAAVLAIVLGGFALLAELGVVHAELPGPPHPDAADGLPRLLADDHRPAVSDDAPPDTAVELQLQAPELPNGCEATSLAMALSAAGCPADKTDIAESALPRESFWYDAAGNRHGPDPQVAYAGDPASASGGWYCLEAAAAAAAQSWLDANGSSARAVVLTGLDQAQLDGLLQAGTPVVAWVTRDYGSARFADYFGWLLPDGSWYVPYDNLHCVLAAGSADGCYTVADPLTGWQTVDAGRFWAGFEALGCRALAIE